MILLFLVDFGFKQEPYFENVIDIIYAAGVLTFVALVVVRYIIFTPKKQRFRVWTLDIFLLIFLVATIFEVPFLGYFDNPAFLYFAFFIIFIRELTTVSLVESNQQINPALLFMISFIFLIVAGTLLLLLPNSTYGGISFVDAIFTSTSAVCVTGLVVVDTGSHFTLWAKP